MVGEFGWLVVCMVWVFFGVCLLCWFESGVCFLVYWWVVLVDCFD